MKRYFVLIATSSAIALLAPSVASATQIEIGRTVEKNAPTCPDNCQAVSRVTGFQTQVNKVSDPFVVPREGRIVAFTMQLGKPNQSQLDFFTQRLGAKSQVRLAVIKPYKKTANKFRFVLNAQSDVFELNKFFGKTVQFPLRTSLFVRKGYIVALTVVTWAPALAAGPTFTKDYAWRASRGKPCSDTLTQAAQQTPGSFTQYFCQYRTARLTYSATEIVNP
ncbi:MAG: hypothetical protein U0R70_14120 [Solirubrobacteraceae bacterium]